MATVDGVASADILGGQTFAMRLWLDPAPHGGARHHRRRRRGGDPGQQFPVGAGPGQGLFHRHQCRRPRPGSPTSISSSRWWSSRRTARWCGMEDIANVELGAQSWTSSVAMNGQHAVFIGVQATPDGNPLSLVQGVRALLPQIERNAAAVGQDGGRLQFDEVHPGLDRRGRNEPRPGGGHRRRRDLPVPRQLPRRW